MLPVSQTVFVELSSFSVDRSGGAGGGTLAKDAIGNDIVASEWLKNHGPGDRTLAQGLKVLYSLHLHLINS